MNFVNFSKIKKLIMIIKFGKKFALPLSYGGILKEHCILLIHIEKH